jgi:hypothetical protein
VPVEDVANAATEALGRLQNGERNLAIHPGCGTNYLVAGAMAPCLAEPAGARSGHAWGGFCLHLDGDIRVHPGPAGRPVGAGARHHLR